MTTAGNPPLLRTLPGEQGQVDWASFGKVRIGRAERALSSLVLTLSYSRALWFEFFLDQTLESFLREHVHASQSFGGTPHEILHDNLGSAVLERRGEQARLHPRYLELAGHYHFGPSSGDSRETHMSFRRVCRTAKGRAQL
jgi:transposase